MLAVSVCECGVCECECERGVSNAHLKLVWSACCALSACVVSEWLCVVYVCVCEHVPCVVLVLNASTK